MTLTKHGHHIPGTTLSDEQKKPMVHRCGGPEICGSCARDVTMYWHPTNIENREAQRLANSISHASNDPKIKADIQAFINEMDQARGEGRVMTMGEVQHRLREIMAEKDLCPTCTGPTRQTVNMKCPDCGKDYS